jgi:hypothetical protein
MEKQWKTKNPFEKAVVDEGWEIVEIKSGVKQIKIEKKTGEKDGKSNSNRNVSKQ